jgi:dCMP deaminase
METRITWDQYYMGMAQLAAKRSACLSRKVGCVLVDNQNRVVSTGYCGPPKGYPHCVICARIKGDTRLEAPGESLYQCHTVHAEMNALLQCKDTDRIHRCYTTTSPCLVCARLLYNTACKEIIFIDPYPGLNLVVEFWHTKLGNTIIQVGGQL